MQKKKKARLKYLCLIILKPVPSGRDKMNDRAVEGQHTEQVLPKHSAELAPACSSHGECLSPPDPDTVAVFLNRRQCPGT